MWSRCVFDPKTRTTDSGQDQPSHGMILFRLVSPCRCPAAVLLNPEKIKTSSGNDCQVDRFCRFPQHLQPHEVLWWSPVVTIWRRWRWCDNKPSPSSSCLVNLSALLLHLYGFLSSQFFLKSNWSWCCFTNNFNSSTWQLELTCPAAVWF